MRPEERELDEEIRGHLAISIQERIDRGEDPHAARLAALREFGYIPAVRDAMRRVWYSRVLDSLDALGQDIRIAVRCLMRARALAATVIVTLALGIGANAAVFSVVRGVLHGPLVNRGEDRIVYIRQSGAGAGIVNMTFSVPEVEDFRARARTIAAFGEFSTTQLGMTGIGEPRLVAAGVVSGGYFDVLGLRPVLGRLLDACDDVADAERVAVLTHGFWTSTFAADPAVVGRAIRLGGQPVRIVGVLEPSIPYPADTEIIANVVTSPHHLGATMVTGRTHRMTELFGRLAPNVSLDEAREELQRIHAGIAREHPAAYPRNADVGLDVRLLRDQIAAPARPILLLLLAAAGVVFVIACSNVANLILARSVRRQAELSLRAALGASRAALRRTLLAESVVLCGAGAVLGLALARPLVHLLARFASRYSVRALEVTVDVSLLWVGAGLAMLAAVVLAFVPRLPSSTPGTGAVRSGPAVDRRLRWFAVAQVACSFVLLAAAAALLAALLSLRAADPGYNTRQVLAIDVPPPATGLGGAALVTFLETATERIGRLPGVRGVAAGSFVPWRDAGLAPRLQFTVEGWVRADGEPHPHAAVRIVAPGFFAVLGVPIAAGRDFTRDDRAGSEPVVIVSRSLAQRMFPNGDAVGRKFWWTDPVFGTRQPRLIVGVVPDIDDERVVPGPVLAVYHALPQMEFAERLFVHASGDPYALVPAVTRIIREIAADQVVERAATLEDVRAQVLTPDRLNAFVLGVFAAVALIIATVGVAGVLAFSVSARTRELGVRLAIGSTRGRLLRSVLVEGAAIAAAGIAAGATGGYLAARVSAGFVGNVQLPGALPVVCAALVLAGAAIVAALMPAARASRIDVMRALRSE